ncbi:DUF4097 family beta strand repeat-containing protein [Ilumatobacter sp.]|uniref:DUF4097 family beta strand repeat-containing protein n=1 Tax=Ilumatobacter sp. TaxID=1967498 RepID=UPI003AF9F10B
MSIATSAPLPTLVFAAFATLAVAGCGVNVSLDDDTTRRIVHDTVPVDGLRGLELATDNGEVQVRGGGVDEIAVRTVLVERNAGDAEYSVDVDGDRLVVAGECDARWWDRCAVGFIVTVPSDFEVDVETGNGRVALSDVDGEVRVETDNGAIEADRIGSTVIDTRTDNGRIRLSFDDAPTEVSATTDNGAIAVRLPDLDLDYAVDADSSRGDVDVDVRTDPASERHVTARSDNGAIDVEYRTG